MYRTKQTEINYQKRASLRAAQTVSRVSRRHQVSYASDQPRIRKRKKPSN